MNLPEYLRPGLRTRQSIRRLEPEQREWHTNFGVVTIHRIADLMTNRLKHGADRYLGRRLANRPRNGDDGEVMPGEQTTHIASQLCDHHSAG